MAQNTGWSLGSLDEARRLSVGGAPPVALGFGRWRPGGYEQQGGQFVRPASAPPVSGFTTRPGMSDAETRQVQAHAGMASQASAPTGPGPNQQAAVNALSGGVPSGWDAAKWNNPNHNTPKYQIGRIAAAGNIQTPEG